MNYWVQDWPTWQWIHGLGTVVPKLGTWGARGGHGVATDIDLPQGLVSHRAGMLTWQTKYIKICPPFLYID